MKKNKSSLRLIAPRGFGPVPALAAALVLCSCVTLWAQAPVQFLIESRTGGQNFGWFATTPPTWTSSTGKSTAPGCTTGIGSRFFTWPSGVTNGTQPTIVLSPFGLVDGGKYMLEVTHIAGGSLCTNVAIDITASGATLSTNKTHVFNGYAGANAWTNTVYFTNDAGVTAPVITFAYITNETRSNGYLGTNQSAGRWYADAFRFTYAGAPCLMTPQIANVDGPLAAGQTFVNVPGVVRGATNVTVYTTDGFSWTKIGEKTSNVTTGLNEVVTTPLVKGTQVVATQWKDGIESCQPTAGREVGGGANPNVRLVYNIREDTALTGPVGADGGTGGDTFFLGSATRIGGFASAPAGGIVVSPSTNWQTLTLTRGIDPMFPIDPVFVWTTTGNPELNGNYGIFDGLGFAISDLTDTGPFQVYIGKVINGDKVIQDFSSATNDQPSYLFSRPSASGFTSDKILPSPNFAVVVATNAGPSGKSLAVGWQFNSRVDSTWLQLLAQGAGTPNPVVDLRQPISVEMLLLPVGESAGTAPIDVTTITNQAVWTTLDANMSVTAVGGGLTYQWYQGYAWSGIPIIDATNSYYTVSNFSSAFNGVYTVAVTDGTRVNTRSTVLYAVDPIPTITNQPVNTIIAAGSTAPAMSVGADGHVPAGYPLTYQWRKDGADLTGATAAVLSFPAGAPLSAAGNYDVVVGNLYGWATSVVAVLSVTTVPAGTGTGLSGAYYTLHTNSNPFAGAPTLTRADATVNFDWGSGSPDPAISADWFTARWFGQVQAVGDDTYTFYTITDDGVRLWVNGQRLVNDWTGHPAATNSQTIALTGSQKYDLVMEYYEQTGLASAKLYWSSASGSVPYQPVPMSQLYPSVFTPPTVALTAPADLTTNTRPVTVTLAATVTTNNAQEINSVGFYANGALVGTATAAPFTYAWVNPPVGVYGVCAGVVYDLSTTVGSVTNLLAVLAIPPTPVTVDGLVGSSLAYSGGSGEQFVLVKSPDVAPTTSWTRVKTNAASPGSFTLPIGSDGPRMFYRILSE